MRRSIFTIVAALAFIVGLFENKEHITGKYNSALFRVTGQTTVSLPSFGWVVFVAHFVFASRLYLHAWYEDEGERLRAATTTASDGSGKTYIPVLLFGPISSNIVRWGEFFCRVWWVLAVLLLPEMYRKGMLGELYGRYIGTELYIVFTALPLVLWDAWMYLAIIEHAESPKRLLQANWLATDFVIFIAFLLAWVCEHWRDKFGAWAIVGLPSGIMLAGLLSGFQMIVFVPLMFEKRTTLVGDRDPKGV